MTTQPGSLFERLYAMWPIKGGQQQYPYVVAPADNPIVVAGSGTFNTTLQLDGDCDKVFETIVCWTSDANYPTQMGFRCEIFYGSNGYSLTGGDEIRGELLFGTAQRPGYISQRPWSLPSQNGRQILGIRGTNLNTTTLTIEIAFRGVRKDNLRQAF